MSEKFDGVPVDIIAPMRYLGLATIKSEGDRLEFDNNGHEYHGHEYHAETPNTWLSLIADEMAEREDIIANIVSSTLPDDVASLAVDGYNDASACEWIVWTTARVYFPVVYDGYMSVGSVPRHPCEEKTKAFGGGGPGGY